MSDLAQQLDELDDSTFLATVQEALGRRKPGAGAPSGQPAGSGSGKADSKPGDKGRAEAERRFSNGSGGSGTSGKAEAERRFGTQETKPAPDTAKTMINGQAF